MSLLYFLSQIFSPSPQILKVNKESTFYLHREIFISRIQLFTLHGKSRNLRLLVRWMGWTPNVFPWNSLTATRQLHFLLKNHLQLAYHQLVLLIISHKCICSLYCVQSEVPEPLLPITPKHRWVWPTHLASGAMCCSHHIHVSFIS